MIYEILTWFLNGIIHLIKISPCIIKHKYEEKTYLSWKQIECTRCGKYKDLKLK